MSTALPVVSMFRGDFLYNLVLIEDTDTIAEAAQKCAEHSVGRRVPVLAKPLQVEHAGEVLNADLTVAGAGVGPMDELIVGYQGSTW